jgi:DNA topoisomerase-6 subunit B
MAKVSPKAPAEKVVGDDLERLHKALGEVKVMAPSATAVVPIGEELLIAGLKRRYAKAEFYISMTRPPSVYRGNPFVVEAGLAFGGDLPVDEPADIMRFANRVPLQYQPKACAISESVYLTNWRGYEVQQPKGGLPVAPMAIAVHLASVWVPFTSEAKEAVAHYDELLREMKLAIQECGRKLAAHIRARAHLERDAKRRSMFEKYIPEVAQSIADILGVAKDKAEKSFYEALPNFVRFTDEEPAKAGNGAPPEGGAPPAAAAATAKAATAKDVTPKDVTPKDVRPKAATPKDVTPKDVTPKDVTLKDPGRRGKPGDGPARPEVPKTPPKGRAKAGKRDPQLALLE